MAEYKMRIKEIYVYPIKSLRGCTLPSITTSAAGFDHDRRFMIQRISNGKHLAVGKDFEMCLFTTELSPISKPTKVLVRYNSDCAFKTPEHKVDRDAVLEIPLVPNVKADGLRERRYDMHGSPTTGYDMPESYNEWFSERFGYDVRLVYIGENRREVLGSVTPYPKKALTENGNPKASTGWLSSTTTAVGSMINTITSLSTGENKENNPSSSQQFNGLDEGISFADVAPFLIVNDKSWENARARLPTSAPLDITKFRPNIVIAGAYEAFEEDFWRELAIGDDGATRLLLTSNCARCASVNVDYDTGKPAEGEPGKILKLLQKDRRVDPGMKYSPIFGRYGFLARKGRPQQAQNLALEIKVGDVVTITKRSSARDRFRKLICHPLLFHSI